MPRGRLPKPDAAKRAAGNPGKRRLATPRAGESARVGGLTVPAWLDAAAKRVWSRLVPDLQRLNFLRPSDVEALGRYAHHMTAWARAVATVRREGEYYDATSVTGEKLKRLHPAVKVAELHEKHLVELEDRFGLSPLARQRILRDQAALPPGSLFADRPAPDRDDPPAAQPGLPEPPPPGSPIGLLSRTLGSA